MVCEMINSLFFRLQKLGPLENKPLKQKIEAYNNFYLEIVDGPAGREDDSLTLNCEQLRLFFFPKILFGVEDSEIDKIAPNILGKKDELLAMIKKRKQLLH